MSASVISVPKSKLFVHTQKDEAIFLVIYKDYWTKLYAIAYNRLQSKHAAEDVVQEVMLSLWHRMDEVEIKNIEAWLSAATRYSVFKQLSKYGTQKIVSLSSQPESGYDQNFDFPFIEKMLKEQIHQLPEKCKLVFEYSRQDGISNKEIAGHLSISEKSVEKHITKAIRKLRRMLK